MEICPYSPELSAYHDGELPGDQRRQLELHLATDCVPCAIELRQWRALSSILAAAPAPSLSPAARQHLYQLGPVVREAGYIRLAEWTTALAASVLIAVSSWLIFAKQTPPPHVAESSDASLVALLNPTESTDLTTEPKVDQPYPEWAVASLSTGESNE